MEQLTVGTMDIFYPTVEDLKAASKARADALLDIHNVVADARHQQGWRYASFDQIMAEIRPILAGHGLSIALSVIDAEGHDVKADSGNTMLDVLMSLQLVVMHETGVMWSTLHRGEGLDAQDRAFSKAQTQALKFAIARTFMVTSQEDATDDSGDTPRAQAGAASPSQDRKGAKPRATGGPTAPSHWKNSGAMFLMWIGDACKRAHVATPDYETVVKPNILKVAHLAEYPGRFDEAQKLVLDWIKSQPRLADEPNVDKETGEIAPATQDEPAGK